jgi:hypothetical protein
MSERVTTDGSGSRSTLFWRVAGTLVLALGGPVIGSLQLADWAKRHVLLASLLLLLYEGGVFCLYVTKELWRRLQDRWLDGIASWVNCRVQELTSRARQSYFEHIYYECRDFDVRGLSTQGTFTLKLEEVFVELSVDPEPSHRASADPIQKLPDRLREGRHDIWQFLTAGQNLALLGAPGTGKTTLLRHVALLVALKGKAPEVVSVPKKIPILLFLRNHAAGIAVDLNLTLAAVVESSPTVKEMSPPLPNGWIKRQLEKGRCLILLDGLDEVADPGVRSNLVRWIDTQMKTYGNNLFVVTSRPYGYRSNPLSSVHTLTVRPFSREQVVKFVSNWYLANELACHQNDDPGVRRLASRGTSDLVRRLDSSAVLTELAVNPLLLTMIATVHKYRSQLPGRRVELYREICEVFLGKRQDSSGVERPLSLTPSQKQCVLEVLSYEMMARELRDIQTVEAVGVIADILQRVSPSVQPEDFLKVIENTSGLLLERESGKYAFAHKTFQEYLAAIHCRHQGLEAELANHVAEDWWHEAIRLYVAQADATPIVQVCLEGTPPGPAALALAVECIEEAQQVEPELRRRVEAILEEEVADEDRQRIYSEALLKLRLRGLVAASQEKPCVDGQLLKQAEYQVFLDDMRGKTKYRQPDYWTDGRFGPGSGKTPIVGIRGSDAQDFCAWVTEREAAWIYRLPSPADLITAPIDGVGCWTISSPGDALSVGGMSHGARNGYFAKLRSYLDQLWELDVDYIAALNVELVQRILGYETGTADGREKLRCARSLVLSLTHDQEVTRILHYDRTLDFYRQVVLSSLSDFTSAVERSLERDLDDTLARAQKLKLTLPHDRSFSEFMDRGLAPRKAMASVIAGIPQLRRRDWLISDRLRGMVGDLEAAIRHPHFIDVVGHHIRDSEPYRDLDYVRISLLPLIAYWTLQSAHTSAWYERAKKMTPETNRATLFDLYVQLGRIRANAEGAIAPVGGIRIVRQRSDATVRPVV